MIEIVKVHRKKKKVPAKNLSPVRANDYSPLRVRNAYDAGGMGRRLALWRPGAMGPNAAILRDLTALRERSRDAYRNNAWITRAVDSWVANEIGTGITFKSQAPDEDFRNAADELWERQSAYFDTEGRDFAAMLSLCIKERLVAGEIFIRRRERRPSDPLPVPLQYQVLEAEHCPHNENQAVAGSRRVRAGIEFNGIGQRTAYLMYRQHPGDMFFDQNDDLELVPVPAGSVMHHYKPARAGQIRGVPATTQALIKAKTFDEYDDAELVRKRDKAAYTGTVTRQYHDLETDALFDPMTGTPLQKDKSGVPTTPLEPGQIVDLLPGEEVKLFDGDTTGSGYAEFVRQALLGLSAGLFVPYEFVSGDFSELNDRTLRVVLAEYHRAIEQDRWQVTIPQICYPTWRDFVTIAIIAGRLPEPPPDQLEEYLKVACHPEGWPYLHELQDANAAILRWKSGLTSRKRIAAERGEDIREIDEENAEDGKRAESLGLDYSAKDSDRADPDLDDDRDDDRRSARNRVRNFKRFNARLYEGQI